MTKLKKLDVFYALHSFQEDELRDKIVVVIDVLRASSTIVTALMNGAKAVIPVADMGEASKISMNVDSDNYLLCGEKDGEKIEGYDLGNSPLEYSEDVVK
jgi:2-phosphosulfolactate phosphatase